MSTDLPQVDPRGMRFAATLTSIVLATAFVVDSPVRELLIGLQAVVFAFGAFGSVRRAPYGLVFARLIRPHLAPPEALEDARPPRFAQLVGFGFSTMSLLLLVLGLTTAGLVVAGFALAAALLNATVGLCVGCEGYLLLRRLTAPANA